MNKKIFALLAVVILTPLVSCGKSKSTSSSSSQSNTSSDTNNIFSQSSLNEKELYSKYHKLLKSLHVYEGTYCINGTSKTSTISGDNTQVIDERIKGYYLNTKDGVFNSYSLSNNDNHLKDYEYYNYTYLENGEYENNLIVGYENIEQNKQEYYSCLKDYHVYNTLESNVNLMKGYSIVSNLTSLEEENSRLDDFFKTNLYSDCDYSLELSQLSSTSYQIKFSGKPIEADNGKHRYTETLVVTNDQLTGYSKEVSTHENNNEVVEQESYNVNYSLAKDFHKVELDSNTLDNIENDMFNISFRFMTPFYVTTSSKQYYFVTTKYIDNLIHSEYSTKLIQFENKEFYTKEKFAQYVIDSNKENLVLNII